MPPTFDGVLAYCVFLFNQAVYNLSTLPGLPSDWQQYCRHILHFTNSAWKLGTMRALPVRFFDHCMLILEFNLAAYAYFRRDAQYRRGPIQHTHSRQYVTGDRLYGQKQCFNCGLFGHLARHCRHQNVPTRTEHATFAEHARLGRQLGTEWLLLVTMRNNLLRKCKDFLVRYAFAIAAYDFAVTDETSSTSTLSTIVLGTPPRIVTPNFPKMPEFADTW